MADIVPYSSFSGMTEYPRPRSAPVLTRPGLAVTIHITLHPSVVDTTYAKFEQWFAGRDEVQLVDVGTSDKAQLGFIILEWMECDIDQLFLSILDSEETVADYCLYGRKLEG